MDRCSWCWLNKWFRGWNRAQLEPQICNNNNVVKACSLSPSWMCVSESVCHNTSLHTVWCRGGLHSFTGLIFQAPTTCIMCVLFEYCLYIFFTGASLSGSKVKLSKGLTFTHLIQAGMHELVLLPQGLKLRLASFAQHFHQWIILLSHSLHTEGFDVWFDTLHWFINVVVHF